MKNNLKEKRDELSLLEKNANPDLPTSQEKIEMYEHLLHDIQLFAQVVMNGDKVQRLIHNICGWSYAHRQGNGEYTEEEQELLVAKHFWKLRDR